MEPTCNNCLYFDIETSTCDVDSKSHSFDHKCEDDSFVPILEESDFIDMDFDALFGESDET